jgi:hypothetical protein
MNMNRGMITLSSSQLTLIQSSILQLQQVPQELPTRIAMALQGLQTQQTQLELNEDSAEAVLDSLPMPQPNEDQLITQTRDAFRTFLTSLRKPSE